MENNKIEILKMKKKEENDYVRLRKSHRNKDILLYLDRDSYEQLKIHIELNYNKSSDEERVKILKESGSLLSYLITEKIRNKDVYAKDLNKVRLRLNLGEKKSKIFNYTFFLNILIESKLLKRSNSYYSDKKNMENSFCKNYDILEPIGDFGLNIDLIDFFGRDYFDMEGELIGKGKEYWLEEYSNIGKLIESAFKVEIDYIGCVEYIKSIIGSTWKEKSVDKRKAIYFLNRLEAFRNKDKWFFTQDDKTGRVYHTITNSPSIFRQFLTIDGIKLVEIDVKNSQPLLLSSLINIESFKKAVEEGTFYDKISEETGWNRDKVKSNILKNLLFDDITCKSGSLHKSLEKLYSGLVEAVKELKKKEPLWKTLQEMEAEIFIKELMVRVKDIDYITIHDSVLVKPGDTEAIIGIINNLYLERGLKVKLEIKK